MSPKLQLCPHGFFSSENLRFERAMIYSTFTQRMTIFSIRSLTIGMAISADYKWTLRGLEDDSEEYQSLIKECHQRAAERILVGCLKNGGLYIKLGQGERCKLFRFHLIPTLDCSQLICLSKIMTI